MNYYELFGIPVSPVVDKDKLQLKYFMLQRKFHPDYHSDRTIDEQNHAMEMSAQINDGFIVLTDAQKSLAYFLEQKGVMRDAETFQLPNSFLMEMMDLNEILDEGNRESYETAVQEVLQLNQNEINQLLAEAKTEWNEKELDTLKACFFKKKYLNRLLDRLND
jgi:molecular chaperone HscB